MVPHVRGARLDPVAPARRRFIRVEDSRYRVIGVNIGATGNLAGGDPAQVMAATRTPRERRIVSVDAGPATGDRSFAMMPSARILQWLGCRSTG